jgi:hypothetical protein
MPWERYLARLEQARVVTACFSPPSSATCLTPSASSVPEYAIRRISAGCYLGIMFNVNRDVRVPSVDKSVNRTGRSHLQLRTWLLALLMFTLASACLRQPTSTTPVDLTPCLQQYKSTTPDPMPTQGAGVWFIRDVIYAAPCHGLAPAGDQRWSIAVVAADDKTVRIYFIGGLLNERCDLLRNISLVESASRVTIQLEAGADPSLSQRSACSAVGQSYVTQIALSKPLAGRTLSGTNKQGEVVHL